MSSVLGSSRKTTNVGSRPAKQTKQEVMACTQSRVGWLVEDCTCRGKLVRQSKLPYEIIDRILQFVEGAPQYRLRNHRCAIMEAKCREQAIDETEGLMVALDGWACSPYFYEYDCKTADELLNLNRVKKYLMMERLTDDFVVLLTRANLYEFTLGRKQSNEALNRVLIEAIPDLNPVALMDVAFLHQADLTIFLPFERGDVRTHWRQRFAIKQVIKHELDGIVCDNPRTRKQLQFARLKAIHIKAHLFWLIMLGKLVYCEASDGSQVVADKGKYALLLDRCLQVLMCLIGFISKVCSMVLSMCSFSWYGSLVPEAQAALDILVAGAIIYFLFIREKERRLIVPKRQVEDDVSVKLLSQALKNLDRIAKNVAILTGSNAEHAASGFGDEMAIPGSTHFPCKACNIGAILVTTNDTDLELFGTFWRLDDFFVTARHASSTLSQTTSRIYLATIKANRKGNYEINRTKVYPVDSSFFENENNLINSFNVDAFVTEPDVSFWSKVGLAASSVKQHSAYNLNIHSVGFLPDGLLVSAPGKTLDRSGVKYLHHTASTRKGFSGSVLLCGNSVIGMHVRHDHEYNVALRREYIEYLIYTCSTEEAVSKNRNKYAYADAAIKAHYMEHKWRGGIAEIHTLRDGKYAIVLQDGHATYGWNMGELAERFGSTGNYRKDEDLIQDMLIESADGFNGEPRARRGRKSSRGQVLASHVEFEDERYDRTRRDAGFENASVDLSEEGSVTSEVETKKTKPRKAGRKKTPKVSYDWLYEISTGERPVHGPSAPKPQPEITQVLSENSEWLKELGYQEGEFAYPAMTPAREVVSIRNHIHLFGDRVKTIKVPPTEEEAKRCSKLVCDFMAPASFVPDADYDQVSGAENVINSTIVGVTKSSGFPYCGQQMPTNAKVLERYGVKGFAQLCVNNWFGKIVIKLFNKGEPTKKKKLQLDMERCIASLPTDALVNHACVFKNFFTQVMNHWREIPVKYAFSPASTGHLEHLKEALPGKVWESDKSNWDFMFYEWIADITKTVPQNLALRNPEWDEDKLQKYRDDVSLAFDQVFKDSVYRTSDGTLIKLKVSGIMKSGWFGTITFNSIAQIVVDVMVKIRLGYTDEQILAMKVVAGGDDVNQEPVPAGVRAYTKAAMDLGVKVEIHERDNLESSEYFSNDIRRDELGRLTFHPKRFTKHIEHLKTVKLDDLANALCSHMENYRHSKEKFKLFENIYHKMRETYPQQFPLALLKSRDWLVAKQYGYESMW